MTEQEQIRCKELQALLDITTDLDKRKEIIDELDSIDFFWNF